jgi:hypothetical protein
LAHAWGDVGHRIVGLIAEHYLDPAVETQVDTIFSGDTTGPVPASDIADEATWADKYRDSDRNTTKVHYNATHNWHFVDIEISSPNIDAACVQTRHSDEQHLARFSRSADIVSVSGPKATDLESSRADPSAASEAIEAHTRNNNSIVYVCRACRWLITARVKGPSSLLTGLSSMSTGISVPSLRRTRSWSLAPISRILGEA